MLSVRRRFYTSESVYGQRSVPRHAVTPRDQPESSPTVWREHQMVPSCLHNDMPETCSFVMGPLHTNSSVAARDTSPCESPVSLNPATPSIPPCGGENVRKSSLGVKSLEPSGRNGSEVTNGVVSGGHRILCEQTSASERPSWLMPSSQPRGNDGELRRGVCPRRYVSDFEISLRGPTGGGPALGSAFSGHEGGWEEDGDPQLGGEKKKKKKMNPRCQDQPLDMLSLKCFLDYCMKQDETLLHLDAFISSVPIGGYASVSKIFSLTPCGFMYPAKSSLQDARESSFTNHTSCFPLSLQSSIAQYTASTDHPTRPGGPQPIFTFLPDSDIFCYTGCPSTASSSSLTVLYLWKWTSSNAPLELNFLDTITAIGFVSPAYFFFSHDSPNESLSSFSNTSPPTKLLLVSTLSLLSLWAVYEDPEGPSPALRLMETPYRCSPPKVRVTCIAGHHESGRLFFGDCKGGVHEFVFAPVNSTHESWMSFLHRLSPWNFSRPSTTLTVSENVSSPSFFRRVFCGILGGSHAIVELTMDGPRGLLYALDSASNIQLFFLPPPDITQDHGVLEYPLQRLATLSHTTILKEMNNIHREVLRVTQQASRHERNLDVRPPEAYPETMVLTALKTNRIVHLFPTKLNEGDAVIAIACCADGTRLYLCARLELPLLPKKIKSTNLPNICEFQHIKSLYVMNWKLPFTSSSSSSSSLPEIQASFYNQKIFLYNVHRPHDTGHLMCVTQNESNVLLRRSTTSPEDASGGSGLFLEEWVQECSLGDGQVLGICEQPTPWRYANLLVGEGSLPNPYDVVSRLYEEKLKAFFEQKVFLALPDPVGLKKERQHGTSDSLPTDVLCGGSHGQAQPLSCSAWPMNLNSDLSPTTPHEPPSLHYSTTCRLVVPPASLPNWMATQTVPGRMFTIFTTRGIFQLQQNRFYDMVKNEASRFIQDCCLAEKSFPSPWSSSLSEFFCTPLSPKQLQEITPLWEHAWGHTTPSGTFRPPEAAAQLDLVSSWRRYPLFNLYCVCTLMPPDQVLSLAWQILTFTVGSTHWKSIQASTEVSVHTTASSRSSPLSTHESTPFALALRSKPKPPEPTRDHHLCGPQQDMASLLLPHKTYQFPLPLLQNALLAWLTDVSVHSGSLFQQGFFPTLHPTPPLPCALDSSSFFLPQTSTHLSARVKGLLLYISRILRPFWSCPIFQTVVLSGSLSECFSSFPALYLIHDAQDFFSLKKLDITNPSAPVMKKEQMIQMSPTSRKRKRVITTNDPSTDYQSKRNKSPHTPTRINMMHPHHLDNCAFLLTTRFTQEEFSKTCDWLTQLSLVLDTVLFLMEADPTPSSRVHPSRHIPTSQIYPPSSNFTKHNPPPDDQFLIKSREPETRATQFSWLHHNDLHLIHSLKKSIQLFCQHLSCCSALLCEATESHVIPESVFAIFLKLSLSTMVIPSSEVQIVMKNILSRHFLPPQLLMERCSLLFTRQDIHFYGVIHCLFTLHRTILTQFQWNADLPYCDEALLERASILRSPGISKALDALLTVAAQPNRTVSLHTETIIVLLVELQLFGYLADFIARLAEATFLELKTAQEDTHTLASTSPHPVEKHTLDVLRPRHFLSLSSDNVLCYRDSPYFPPCYRVSYYAVEIILTKYLNLDAQHKSPQNQSRVLAGKFVTACLALHPELDPNVHDLSEAPKHLSRTWLQYIVLDWINETGRRTFPIPLEDAQTPVYPSWVNQRQFGSGLEATRVLSKFFYNNGFYCQFAEFLFNLALKPWKDPTQALAEIIDLPNGESTDTATDSDTRNDVTSFLDLKNHASSTFYPSSSLALLDPVWSKIVHYLRVTSCGLTLEQRYTYLLEARDTIRTRLSQLQHSHDLPHPPHVQRSTPLSLPKDTLQSLTNVETKVEHAIDTILLQASLCREVIEICCFLWVKYGPNPQSSFLLAFSTDHPTRTKTIQALFQQHPNQYQYFHNVQSLLYLLRWKIYDSPLDLLSLVQEFADATKSLIPFPGLCFLTHQAFLPTEQLPLVDEPDSSTISRQSIVSAAVFCRGFIAAELESSDMLCDFVSKFMFSIIEARALHPRPPLSHGVNLKDSTPPLSSSLRSQDPHELQINFLAEILLTLHEVAVVFRDKAANGSLKKEQILHPVCPDFNWTTHWWIWPSLLIQQQLTEVDNRIAWDHERQLEGQQKLPLLSTLVREYQKMMDTQAQTQPTHDSKDNHDESYSQTPNPSINQLDIHEAHYLVILFYLRVAWMKQLLGMASSLAYIHLLSPDLVPQSTVSPHNRLPTDTSWNPPLVTTHDESFLQIKRKNASFPPSATDMKRHTLTPPHHFYAGDSLLPLKPSSTQKDLFSDLLPVSTPADQTIRGQNQLHMHLQTLYYTSPSRLQFFLERCHDLIKGSQQVLHLQKDWYSFHQPSIEKYLVMKQFNQTSQDFVLHELHLAERAFLSTLENFQQRIPTLQVYHLTIQQVLTQKTI